MSEAEAQPTAPKPKLRWFQYSLRTLLVLVTLCAIPCSWFAVKKQQAKREREAATAIEELGGSVAWSEPRGQEWLRGVLGDDLFMHVEVVELFGPDFTDDGLENLKRLKGLKLLSLDGTVVTDAGLGTLKGLEQLDKLRLTDTWWETGFQFTDEGVNKLQQALPKCAIHWEPRTAIHWEPPTQDERQSPAAPDQLR